jgi:hypothetical protein
MSTNGDKPFTTIDLLILDHKNTQFLKKNKKNTYIMIDYWKWSPTRSAEKVHETSLFKKKF